MIILLEKNATENDLIQVARHAHSIGYQIHLIESDSQTVLACSSNGKLSYSQLQSMAAQRGVERLVPISTPYKLANKEWKTKQSVVTVAPSKSESLAPVRIGGGHFAVMAGPCSVESRNQILQCAESVKRAGAQFLRGGVYKPRSSPYSFQGLEEQGLKLLAEARELTGLFVVTEVVSPVDVPLVTDYADVLQVGSRNMQNFALLKELGKIRKPVLLKRGMSCTLQEWLMAAEYILCRGNCDVILCERGIRTFEDHTRNTLDVSAIPALKELTHLPVIVDPSHATGLRSLVIPVAKAAVAAGADGLIVEIHPDPDKAWSDGSQSLYLHQFDDLMRWVGKFLEFEGRTMREEIQHEQVAEHQAQIAGMFEP